jgi:tetratricopeptide (TPR) repeat protein
VSRAQNWFTAGVAAALALTLVVPLVGCNEASESDARRAPSQTGTRGGLFESVAVTLDRLEQYESDQILKQTCDRLNQWFLQERPQLAWQPDPLLAELDDELRNQPEVSMLEGVRFQAPDDGWYLQEAVWLRNISNKARADQFDDLDVARQLFDWTVRNIQLEADWSGSEENRVRHRPFETLMFGRGTAIERAWIFALLARQQGLNVVFLGIQAKDGAVRPWLPALVADDKLYLFDTRLGMPIPGPTPGSVATLSEVVENDALLRKLDLDAEHPYPVTSEDLKHVVAYVEATPPALSRRMALVESRLTGNHKMKLTSPGHVLAEQVAKLPHVTAARLWPMPFEVYLAKARRTPEQDLAAAKELVVYQVIPSLRMGRILHFKGQYDGEGGAKSQYLNARPPDRYILDFRMTPEEAQHYMSQGYSREVIAKMEAAKSLLMREAKQNASYWLGLIFFEEEDYPNAIDFLANRTLGTDRESPWAASARYNLARAYEASGEPAKASELYESDKTSPQSQGNQLRGRWLKEKAEAKEPQSPETAPEQEATSATPPSTPVPSEKP